MWRWVGWGSLGATPSVLSRAGGWGGALTWEPWSSQKPSHQLLKAELPIIRRKRDTVKRESKYPARGGRGGPAGSRHCGRGGRHGLGFLGPSPAGRFQTRRKRAPWPWEPPSRLMGHFWGWGPEPESGHPSPPPPSIGELMQVASFWKTTTTRSKGRGSAFFRNERVAAGPCRGERETTEACRARR